MATIDLKIRDSVLDPEGRDRAILFRPLDPAKGTTLYRVFLYLDGPFLPYVESVTYRLHETFSDRNRTVHRTPRNPLCKLEIWTWSLFNVAAEIKDKRGQSFQLDHWLTYSREIEKSEPRYFQAVA